MLRYARLAALTVGLASLMLFMLMMTESIVVLSQMPNSVTYCPFNGTLATYDDLRVKDGLPDWYETEVTLTEPKKSDSDNPPDRVTDGNEDPDADGLTNALEHQLGTNPWNPDSDGDGKLDGNVNDQDPRDPAK